MTTLAWPLFGHEQAEQLFLSAVQSARLHHGWLLEGPSGVGKARLARRMAAAVLGASSETGTLDFPVGDSVVQKIAADGHPDLKWICRRPDEKGKLRQDIPVDAIRGVNQFFALRAGLGGWRVGVIDALDELNRSGANALLKTLEEPPGKCLLVLISHGTKPILPTIRSRCRALKLGRLSDEDTEAALKRSDVTGEILEAACHLSHGRPGHGLRLATPSGRSGAHAAHTFLKALPRPSDAVLADFIQRGGDSEEAFAAACEASMAWIEEKAADDAQFADIWLRMSGLLSNGRNLALDRTQVLSKFAAGLLSAK